MRYLFLLAALVVTASTAEACGLRGRAQRTTVKVQVQTATVATPTPKTAPPVAVGGCADGKCSLPARGGYTVGSGFRGLRR